MKVLSTLMFGLLILTGVFGQKTAKCGTIYNSVEFPAKYKNDEATLRKYLEKEFTPLVGNCMERGDELIASLYIILTIDKTGKVIDVSFARPELTIQCANELKLKLLEMSGWTPAKLKGKAVCSYSKLNISCLKWD